MKQRWWHWWWLLLLLPIVAGLLRLRFDAEVLDLLPANVRAVAGLKLYQQHFTTAHELIVTIQAPDADAAKAAAQALAEALRHETNLVAEVTWQPPWLEHPEQAAELIASLWLNQPPVVFTQLAHRLAETNLTSVVTESRNELATTLSPAAIAQLGYDPFGLTRLPDSVAGAAPGLGQGEQLFASADGSFRILFVKARGDLTGYRECSEWLDQITRVASAVVPPDGKASVGYTGRPAFVTEIAASMKRDITLSVGGTAIIIALLFWLAHRRWKPMLWLLTLLALILAATLALGGLIFGVVSVVSMGFAAILLGLAVDYAVVHYQEALAQPELSVPQIRRAIAPSIFWAAFTTISAFIVLNFGGLPGLGQLGSLVGVGVALSACVMIFAYLPPLFPDRMRPAVPGTETVESAVPVAHGSNWRTRTMLVFTATIAVLACCVVVLSSGLPKMDASADALQPRGSHAYAGLDAIKKNLGQSREPLWLVVTGRDEGDVATRLEAVEPILDQAVSNQMLTSFTSPLPLWPRPDFQAANRAAAQHLVAEGSALHAAALDAGFSEDALGLTREILATWQRATAQTNVFWPTNPMSAWIYEKLATRETNGLFAAGFLYPGTNTVSLAPLEAQLPRDGVWLSSWELLGGTVLAQVRHNLWKLLLPMIGLVLLSLGLAFRRFAEIFLSLGVLLFSAVCLLTVMKLAGWSWNLLNLMALPLVLGTGVDYSIFMQLALRRHGGDLQLAHRSVGRALLLCGGTAIAGFGSLGLSSNAGMASLGRVCAIGIAANMLFSVFLLPTWWRTVCRRISLAPSDGERAGVRGSANPQSAIRNPQLTSPVPHSALRTPSSFYGARLWQLGLAIVRIVPPSLCELFGKWVGTVYWLLASHRRKIVIENLLPVYANDRPAAKRAARELFQQFALKIVDLWRYESGAPAADWFVGWQGWDAFNKCRERGRGVLLVTLHLGNWELGGAVMERHGQKLLVLTQPEPDPRLTAMREASRAARGIETLVVGGDAFAFLEIIKRLQAGATVALLVDRPPPQTAVQVTLFDRPFAASIAVAELARASGCAIMAGTIARGPRGYHAQILPEIVYDRAAIGSREGRIALTQQIMRACEPAIRQYATQWYHFVPIWPASGQPPVS